MSKATDNAYLAGLLDGEGTISFVKEKTNNCKRGYTWKFTVCIDNTNPLMMEWIKNTYTDVGVFNSFYDKRSNLKMKHRWTIKSREIKTILPLVKPYLTNKKELARLILKAISLQSEHYSRYTPHDEKLGVIHDQMRFLNSRGVKAHKARNSVTLNIKER